MSINNQLKFIKNVSWKDTFSYWKKTEGIDPSWQQVAKEKGFKSWEEWRGDAAKQLQLPDKKWKLYKIKEPRLLVPRLLIGPFKTWQKHFKTILTSTFKDLIEDNNAWVVGNKRIQNAYNNLPFDTTIILAWEKTLDELIVLEGHHRCSAINQAIINGEIFKIPKLQAYVVEIDISDKMKMQQLVMKALNDNT